MIVQKAVTHCQALVLHQRHRLRLFRRELHSRQHVIEKPSAVMIVRRRVSKGRANIVFAPKIQSPPTQINLFDSMQNDPNSMRAFEDTRMRLAVRC